MRKYSKEQILMMKMLKNSGFEMEVYACGCCDGPYVVFKSNNEIVIDEGTCNFNTKDLKEEANE
jgi:hypothetical protein